MVNVAERVGGGQVTVDTERSRRVSSVVDCSQQPAGGQHPQRHGDGGVHDGRAHEQHAVGPRQPPHFRRQRHPKTDRNRIFLAGGCLKIARMRSRWRLNCAVERTIGIYYHPGCSCRMGPAGDPTAVVDATGAVHGLAGLSVCDASIFPLLMRANTNLPSTLVSTLAIDSSAPSTEYAGMSGVGVFKSTDGGVSWKAVNTGLIATTVSMAVAFAERAGDRLLAQPRIGMPEFRTAQQPKSDAVRRDGIAIRLELVQIVARAREHGSVPAVVAGRRVRVAGHVALT